MSFPARPALPLNIGNVQVMPTMLHGHNYISGFPTIMQAFLNNQKIQFSAYTQDKTVIYIGPGRQRCFVTSARGWLPGSRLLAVAYDSIGTPIYVLMRVFSYNAVTGELWFENLYQNLSWPNLYGNWYITAAFPDTILNAPLAIASGGTGVSDIDSVRLNLLKPRARWGWPIMFDDFVGTPVAAMANSISLGNNPTINRPTLGTSPDLVNHPGVASIDVSTVAQTTELWITPGMHVQAGGVGGLAPSGAGTAFEAVVHIPILSTSAERFTLLVGMTTSNQHDYMTINYADDVNGGKWQASRGVSSVDTSTDTGITVTAGTWYKIRYDMATDTGNIGISINGVSVGTYALPNSIIMKWEVRMVKRVGTTLRSVLCDYLFLRQMQVAAIPRD